MEDKKSEDEKKSEKQLMIYLLLFAAKANVEIPRLTDGEITYYRYIYTTNGYT